MEKICPKCHAEQSGEIECKKCGIIFSRIKKTNSTNNTSSIEVDLIKDSAGYNKEQELKERKLTFVVFFIAMMFFGIAYANFPLQIIMQGYGSPTWATVDGVVEFIDIKEKLHVSPNFNRPSASVEYTYEINAQYRYAVNDITYIGNRIIFDHRNDGDFADSIREKYRPGNTKIFYNPAEHSESVLIPGIPSIFIHKLIIGCFIFIVGVLGCRFILFPTKLVFDHFEYILRCLALVTTFYFACIYYIELGRGFHNIDGLLFMGYSLLTGYQVIKFPIKKDYEEYEI